MMGNEIVAVMKMYNLARLKIWERFEAKQDSIKETLNIISNFSISW